MTEQLSKNGVTPASINGRVKLLGDENHTVSEKELEVLEKYFHGTDDHQPLIPDLFRQVTKSNPEVVAVCYGEEKVTYTELDRQSDQIAAFLAEREISNQVIAVCLDKSVHWITAMLGIFKSGNTYLPIDGKLPAERILFLLEDSEATLVIGGHPRLNESQIREQYEEKIITVNDLLAYRHELPFQYELTDNDTAYLIYTSGSTGLPKGVMISARSAAHHARKMSAIYRISAGDRVLQSASWSFDLSVEQVIITITSGATLYLADDEVIHSHNMIGFLIDHQITFCSNSPKFTESIFSEIMNDEQITGQLALETMEIGGEAADADFCRRWSESVLAQKCQLFNAYGPTEATVASTVFAVPAGFIASKVPIGKPIPGTSVYVINENGKPAAPGEKGEICVAGIRVGKGYLKRPELNSQSFIEADFANGQRVYKTGDLGRWNEQGELLFEGRKDDQLKIRGFRIEPGEIEVVLNEMPLVSNSYVTAVESPGGFRLIAFVESHKQLNKNELKEFLEVKLPVYMVPSDFHISKKFPLNINGKTDKQQLISTWKNESRKTDKSKPVSAIENEMLGIWKEFFGLEDIGIKEDFFALGGQSILAIRIISRIAAIYRKKLTLRQFYDHSTIAALSALLENASHITETVEKVRRPSSYRIPATANQRSLWLLDKIRSSAVYNISQFYYPSFRITAGHLRSATEELVKRHDSLRTTFREENGSVYQVIHEYLSPEFTFGEASDLISDTENFATTLFDLENGPLTRVLLLEDKTGNQCLGLSFHHTVMDGWSFDQVCRELMEVYEDHSNGKKTEQTSAGLQFADFAQFTRSQEDSKAFYKGMNFWHQLLSDYQGLDFPYDKLPKTERTGAGGYIAKVLSPSQRLLLNKVGAQKKVSGFTIFLSAVYILLQKITAQTDVCVGVPMANREAEGSENIIGYLVNSLPVRINPTEPVIDFSQLLKQVDLTLISVRDHQFIPLETLIERFSRDRHSLNNPFFNIQVNQVPVEDPEWLNSIDLHNATAKFDLTFDYRESANGDIRIGIEYSTDLFAESTVRTYQNYLNCILEEVCRYPDEPLSSLSLFGKNTANVLEGATVQLPEMGLHQMVAEQATLTPENIALLQGDISLNYRSLEERVLGLSAHIQEKGVQEGDIVAVLCERSIDMVVSFLAVMQSGAAYLPLSRDLPAERISYMLNDSKSAAIITDKPDDNILRELISLNASGADKIITPSGFEGLHIGKQEEKEVKSSNPAYVIYTSGSTGKPKGVVITHRAIVNHMAWMKNAFQWSTNDVFLQKTAVTFDASVWEFYLPLIMGNQLVLSQTGDQTNPQLIAEEIKKYQVTTLQGTPTFLDYLSDYREFGEELKLKRIFSGGEALPSELAADLKRKTGAEIINLYGPTECTIDATYHICSENDQGGIVPIGKPINNMSAYVLDEHGKSLPPGIKGELHLAGEGLSPGYLGNGKLTASAFIKSSEDSGKRLYKTGDLVKSDLHGNLLYLGRKDHQLKVRGVRIEASEIESVLTEYPKVSQTVVVLSGDQLVAYYTSSETLAEDFLRKTASDRLPVYMIPSRFIKIDEMPLTAGGKADRKTLSARPVDIQYLEIVSPETDLQKQVHMIWSAALNTKSFGITDNFFAIGGHSLAGIRILSDINHEMQLDITLKELFDTATISALCELITDRRNNSVCIETEDILSTFGEDSEELIL